MITRRIFIKQLLAMIALATGGAALSDRYLGSEQAASVDPPAEGPQAPASAEPAVSDQPLLSFFLLSDLHISVADTTIGDKLHVTLKDVSKFESPVDTIIFGGDVTDFGRDIEYKQLRKILDSYKLPPIYANMGNHDYYDIWLTDRGAFSTDTVPNGKTDAMCRERFMTFFGYKEKPYTDVWLQDVHLILLSQECYVQEKPDVGEGAWYSDEQLAWFETKMKEHADGRPAFIFIHQPLPAPGTDGGTHRLIRAKRFREILKPYRNAFVFSGHTHRNFLSDNHYNQENTFHWFNNASVGKTRASANGGPAIQGMYVQIYSHQVVVKGREFTDRSWIPGAEWTVPIKAKARTSI
ncbi:metallophosphoesterase family protein [Paenibacillus puerhi]|uniref:metallophosphoesterase family protein n=1 Tax=Paenibacillus puerhi TaxID=2692622 RepID=UPI0013587F2A|nr:metallophosphoesterase [Paenibacillus puerhi]